MWICVLYGGDYDMWERACAFSQGLIDRVPVHRVLYDDSVFIWLFCLFLCMHTDNQDLIKRSLMMLVISILTHVTSGHPD